MTSGRDAVPAIVGLRKIPWVRTLDSDPTDRRRGCAYIGQRNANRRAFGSNHLIAKIHSLWLELHFPSCAGQGDGLRATFGTVGDRKLPRRRPFRCGSKYDLDLAVGSRRQVAWAVIGLAEWAAGRNVRDGHIQRPGVGESGVLRRAS